MLLKRRNAAEGGQSSHTERDEAGAPNICWRLTERRQAAAVKRAAGGGGGDTHARTHAHCPMGANKQPRHVTWTAAVIEQGLPTTVPRPSRAPWDRVRCAVKKFSHFAELLEKDIKTFHCGVAALLKECKPSPPRISALSASKHFQVSH